MPTLSSYLLKRVLPVHAQLFEEGSEWYLLPFSSDISVYHAFAHEIHRGEIVHLDIEDRISIGGINLFWQQWIVGLGLKCEKCRYYYLRLPDDNWCWYCKDHNYNPAPYIYGYSQQFAGNRLEGYYNYTDCNKCNLKPNWCVECDKGLVPEPKNRSFKEHVAMYLKRLSTYELQTVR